MSQKINFVVAEPCHEDWNSMSRKEQGRFCEVCSKCVVDLTRMNIDQIAQAYEENEGNMCGRMTLSQHLGQRVTEAEPTLSGQALKRLQMFAAAFALAFGFLIGSSGKAHGQQPVKMGKVAYIQHDARITGKVQWTSGEPVGNSSLELVRHGQSIRAMNSGADGHFQFSDLAPGSYTLIVNGGKWAEQKLEFELSRDEELELTINLQNIMIMGDIMTIDTPQVKHLRTKTGIEEEPETTQVQETEVEESEEGTSPGAEGEAAGLEERCFMVDSVKYEYLTLEIEPVIMGGIGVEIVEVSEGQTKAMQRKQERAERKALRKQNRESVHRFREWAQREEKAELNPGEQGTSGQQDESFHESEKAMEVGLNSTRVTVYPNPTQDEVRMLFTGRGKGMVDYHLIDMQGRVLLQGTWDRSVRSEVLMDLRSQPVGVYLLKLSEGDVTSEHRIVKIQ